MRYITDEKELEEAMLYLRQAAEVSDKSHCKKSHRGAIVIRDGYLVASGFNKPTIEDLCCLRDTIHDNSHVECCTAIHAEEMAIVRSRPDMLAGGTMYHIKVKAGEMLPSGPPSCTTCSRSVLESGIKDFVIWHPEGICVYGAEEFNRLSFEYFLNKK
jgi:deoxycytidylate deaminase